jgi:hypothetical protein
MHRYLRVLIPAFRFFDRVGDEVELWVRADGEPWQNALIPPPLPWYGLLLNPEWGMHHALCNAVQQLVVDLSENAENVLNTDSYKMARFLLLRKCGAPSSLQFQLRLAQAEVWTSPEGAN